MMRKWFEVYRRSAQGWVKIRVINSDDIEAARAARDEARGLDTASEYEIRSYCEEVVVARFEGYAVKISIKTTPLEHEAKDLDAD